MATEARVVSRDSIDTADEAELTRYFARAQIAFERSPSGAILERANAYWTAAREDVEQRSSERAERRRDRRRAERRGESLGPDEDAMFGLELSPHISLNETALFDESGQPVGAMPSDHEMFTAASVGRRLLHVARAGGAHAVTALATYYGAEGQHFDAGNVPRIASLYCLTHAGQQLLKRAEVLFGKSGLELPPYAQMRVHCILRAAADGRRKWDEHGMLIAAERQDRARAKAHSRYEELREFFTRAADQAEALYRESARRWNATSHLQRDRRS